VLNFPETWEGLGKEALMDPATLLLLTAIALIDSTSIGTLAIPLWLMLDRRRSAANVLLYLTALCVFYFAVGLALMLGARFVIDALGAAVAGFLATPAGGYAVLAAGAGLIVLSFAMEPKRRERAHQARRQRGGPSWNERFASGRPRTSTTIALALVAGVVEVATMLPYLAAIGIMSALDVPAVVRTGLLVGYVLVMVVPALVLLVVRQVAGARVTDRLDRLRAWLTRNSAGTISILILVLGINVAIRGLAMVQ
jgi:hypothetical protein